MTTFPFAGKPDSGQSEILDICDAERERQMRQLIMIPSETICHPAAAEVLKTEFGNVYAEGLPQPLLCPDPRPSARDRARFESWVTRLSDRRFYKGTVGADRVELAAQDAVAHAFARADGSPAPESIFVNVQPLSGAAANLAVYEALLSHGDRLMGLDLAHGGHLTHGSRFNFSGKTYEASSYGVLPGQTQLDYAHVRAQALAHRPKLIIGGASAYPWDFDWQALREIADEIGAYLLADVAHTAGMIVAGHLNNPLPYAHVVTFTTHKSLCGPRGACILTTDPRIASKIDLAVFPGLQGGPHVNSFAAIGRLFELIHSDYDGFRRFQSAVISNTAAFGRALVEEGFSLEYGGGNTHMLLVNLREFKVEGAVGLDGEIAARLLEIAGIICNKNMIPGDADAAHARGLRFGLPWLTQRGVTEGQIRSIAKIIRRVLSCVHTFSVVSPGGEEKCRGRVHEGVLREAAGETAAIAETLPYPPRTAKTPASKKSRPLGDRSVLLVRGDKAHLALGQMLSIRLPVDRTAASARMFDAQGEAIDDVIVKKIEPRGLEERWLLLPHADRAHAVRRWIEDLSDGYLLFDPADVDQKVDGPTVVEELDASALSNDVRSEIEKVAGEPAVDLTKPYFIGQRALYAKAKPPAKPEYRYAPPELPLRKTVLNAVHHASAAKMVPFAGWEMPVQYPTGIFAEHRAVRTAAGLFDVSHMSVLEVRGRNACAFLDQVLASCVSRLVPGQAQYSYILRPDGTAIDDLFLYRMEPERFLIVSNASNSEAVIDWISAAKGGRFLVDLAMPAKALDGPVDFRPLRDAGEASLIDLAFQGPASLKVLVRLADDHADAAALRRLVPNEVAEVNLLRSRVVVAHTGYTGERVGFEILIHPARAGEFWSAALDAGKSLGVIPAGLGARDSTRLEAGFPLFGHELEGDLGISLTEAGYGFVPRFHVPFFVGRGPYMGRARRSRRHLLRLAGQGRKSLRAGHAIVDSEGRPVGQVTSFAYVHEDLAFVALACVDESFRPPTGEKVTGVRMPRAECGETCPEKSRVEMTVLDRFPGDAERDAWPTRYA